MSLVLTSTAYDAGGDIPAMYTCDGADISPPLSWSGVPAAAKSLVLIIDDPDAPDPAAPQKTWTHWLLYNIAPNTDGLPQAVKVADLSSSMREGLNDWNRRGYGGPCPRIGRHRYFHKLYALDTVLPDLGSPSRATLERTMQGHIVDQSEMIGLYQRKR